MVDMKVPLKVEMLAIQEVASKVEPWVASLVISTVVMLVEWRVA